MGNDMNKKELITRDLMTVPNALSFMRVVLITPFVAFFVTGLYVPAIITLVVSGLSDCLDGLIARKFHQESEFGKIIDPLADKLTLLALGICVIFIDIYTLPLIILMIIKDILMIIGGVIIVRKGMIPPKSAWYGKLSTMLFYVTIGAIVLLALLGYKYEIISISLLCVTAAMMVYSLVNYTVIYVRLMKNR